MNRVVDDSTLRSALRATVLTVLVGSAAWVTASRWWLYIQSIGDAGTVASFIGRDFRAFSVAAGLAVQRNLESLYSISATPFLDANASPFAYPIWFAFGISPWSMLSERLGYWLWIVAGVAAAGVALWMLTERVWPLFAIIALLPGYQMILLGQSAYIALAGVAIALWAMRDNRPVLAGAVLGLLAFKPHLVLGLVLLAMLRPRDRGPMLASFVATVVALFVAGEVVVPGSSRAWAEFILSNGEWLIDARDLVNLAAFTDVALGGSGSALIRVGLAIAGVLLLFFVVRRSGHGSAVALFVAVAIPLVFGFRAMPYDSLILIAPFVVIWNEYPGVRRMLTAVGLAAVSVMTISPFLNIAIEVLFGFSLIIGPLALAALTFAVVALAEGEPDSGSKSPHVVGTSSGTVRRSPGWQPNGA